MFKHFGDSPKIAYVPAFIFSTAAGMNAEDGVGVISGAGEHPLELDLLQALLEIGKHLRRLFENGLIVLGKRQLEILPRVVDVGLELLAELDLLLGCSALSERGLRLVLVIPEPLLTRKRIEFVDLSFQLNQVKGAPLAQQHAFGGQLGRL